MRRVKAAATQMACSWDLNHNLANAEKLIRLAAKDGANIILLQELFETPYFCQQQRSKYFNIARTLQENSAVNYFSGIAKELHIVLPISFYEKHGNTAFNSTAVIDANGSILGIYRKTHIPDGLPYAEKFYFTPGDTGFKVWDTQFGKIGIGICWDQWFPEAARSMALLGAELIFYPTAIGSELADIKDSMQHWRRCMQGHAAANMIPVIASNRIGTEKDLTEMTFYGSSFITDEYGEITAEADRVHEAYITAEFDLDKIAEVRRGWGMFRDRRPEMYQLLLSH